MIKAGHISGRQATAIMTIILVTKLMNPIATIIIRWGQSAADTLAFLSGLIMLVLVLPILPLVKDTPKTLFGLMREHFGKVLGTVFSIFLLITLSLDTAVVLRADVVQVQLIFAPQTPLPIIESLILLVAVYASYLGLEAIARSNLIAFFLLIVLIITLFIITQLFYANWMNLAPILGPGIPTLLTQGILHAGFYGELLILFNLRIFVRDYKSFKTSVFSSQIISVSVSIIAFSLFQLVFPYPSSGHLFFPFIELAKLIYFGRFIQHIEAAFAITWLIVGLLRITIMVYVLSFMMADICNTQNVRRFIPSIAIFIFYGTLIPPSLVADVDFKDVQLMQYGIFVYGLLPIAIAVVAYLRKRKNNKKSPSTEPQGGPAHVGE